MKAYVNGCQIHQQPYWINISIVMFPQLNITADIAFGKHGNRIHHPCVSVFVDTVHVSIFIGSYGLVYDSKYCMVHGFVDNMFLNLGQRRCERVKGGSGRPAVIFHIKV